MGADELRFLGDEVFPALLRGLEKSFLLIVPSAIMGTVLGVLTGAIRVYGPRWVVWMAETYVTFFRGIPLVVQLFIWYFGLPHVGIFLSPYAASVVGFSLCSGAYQSEYVRGALLSIRQGQTLAAQALGFSKFEMVRSVILPQGFRRALPGCGNEVIYLIKYSSLAYMVTFIELTGEAKILASHSFKYMEVFLVVGVFYLGLVTVAGWFLRHMEQRLAIPGFEHHRI
ncbi:MAG: amino acid ABC transporter permease [Syntrophobacteraceae bacterium]|jgi:polar amino acid transport system permease protein|nr:amino acid ABC transporter permease [Syntrophobacteraceae bacterium]